MVWVKLLILVSFALDLLLNSMLIRIGDRVDSIEVQSFEIDNFDHLPQFASIYAEWFGDAAASPIHLLKSRRAIDARGIKWMIAIVVDVVL